MQIGGVFSDLPPPMSPDMGAFVIPRTLTGVRVCFGRGGGQKWPKYGGCCFATNFLNLPICRKRASRNRHKWHCGSGGGEGDRASTSRPATATLVCRGRGRGGVWVGRREGRFFFTNRCLFFSVFIFFFLPSPAFHRHNVSPSRGSIHYAHYLWE